MNKLSNTRGGVPDGTKDKPARKGQIVQIHFLSESIGQQCPRMRNMTASEAATYITELQERIKDLKQEDNGGDDA